MGTQKRPGGARAGLVEGEAMKGQRMRLEAVAEAAQQYRNARRSLQQAQDDALWDASQRMRVIRIAAERLKQAERRLFEAIDAWEQQEEDALPQGWKEETTRATP